MARQRLMAKFRPALNDKLKKEFYKKKFKRTSLTTDSAAQKAEKN
jgi:hypothetical protein